MQNKPRHPVVERIRIGARPTLGRRLSRPPRIAWIAALILLGTTGLAIADGAHQFVPRYQAFSDPEGHFANLNLGGPTDTSSNPFFQDLGTNGRRCVTCHQPSDAFSVTPPHIRERF